MGDMPREPMTELAANAAMMHEAYCAYVDAGFTEAQAMQLLCAIVSKPH